MLPPQKKSSKGLTPDSRNPTKLSGSITKAFANIFQKKICGDIFSQNNPDEGMAGMMYQSRARPIEHADVVEEEKDVAVEADSVEDQKLSITCGDDSDSEKEQGPMNPKQQLVLTIQNWTLNKENDLHVMQEGGVHALIALAGFDDPGLKSCVVNALYNLSKRENNRNELLNIGACAAIITVTLSPRTTWKIARLCALTLSNLSMAGKGGEYIMGKVNVHTALTILMGIRNHKLLPVCAQALYNLTCVNHYYPQLDRVMKALLTLPVMTGKDAFDAVPLQTKALVNCTRFHVMRDRLIEDGSLGVFRDVITGIQRNEGASNRAELIFHVVTSLRCFSETKSCLNDLMSKQAVDLLQQVYRYCDESSRLLVVKTLRNMMKIVKLFPAVIYASGVDIVCGLSEDSENVATLQHVACCFHIFTQDNLRGNAKLAVALTRALPKLLQSKDPVTQYYSVATAGNLFFMSLAQDTISSDLEHLVLTFREAARFITDHAATQAVTEAFAKLSQEERFMTILCQHRKICPIIMLLLRTADRHMSNLAIQESCCVAICRFTLRVEPEDLFGFRETVSTLLFRLLGIGEPLSLSAPPSTRHAPHRSLSSVTYMPLDADTAVPDVNGAPSQEQVNVLVACVSSIKALAEQGIYYAEMRGQREFLTKLAHIAAQFRNHALIPRLACATLSIYSFDAQTHPELSTARVMEVLFTLAESEDFTVKELVCTMLCNVSNCVEARPSMLENGVMLRLTELSGTTNELLQELCARCLCNLTCSVDQHAMLIEKKGLDTLLLIALVRSGSNTTKQLAVRAMLNMLNSDAQLDAIVSSGTIAALASLSEINNGLIQTMCARGFLVCSTWSDKSRAELCARHNTLTALFGLLKSGKETKMTVLVGRAVCNLLADPASRRAVVSAGGLSVLKIIATTTFDELRESTARVIMILVGDKSVHPFLLREPIVSVLVYILQDKSSWSLNCAVGAFTSLAQQAEFRPTLIEKGCIPAIVGAVLNGRVTSIAITEEICRILCLLSYETMLVDVMLKGHVLVAMYCLYKGKLCSTYGANMMAITLRNMSGGIEQERVSSTDVIDVDTPSASAMRACEYIVEQEGFRLLGWLLHDYHLHNPYLYRSIVITLHNLCKVESLHERMIQQNFMRVLYQVALYSGMMAHAEGEEDLACSSADSTTDHSDSSPQITDAIVREGSPSNKLKRRHRQPLLNAADVYNLSTAIELISRSTTVRPTIVEGRCVPVLHALSSELTELSRFKIVSALTNLAAAPECRENLVQQRANDLLIKLSEHAETEETQQQCTMALSSLSKHASVNSGVMSSLLVLSLRLEGGSSGATGGITSPGAYGTGSVSPTASGTPTVNTDRPGNVGGPPGTTTNLRASILEHIDKVPTTIARGDLALRVDQHSDGMSILSPDVNTSHALMSPSKHDPSELVPVRSKTYAEEALELSDISPATKEEEMGMLGSVNADPVVANLTYEVKAFSINIEMGGSAKKVKFDLPLPTVSAHDAPSTMTSALSESLHGLPQPTHSALIIDTEHPKKSASKGHMMPAAMPGMYKSSSMVISHQSELTEEDPMVAVPTIKNLNTVELNMHALSKDEELLEVAVRNAKTVVEPPPPAPVDDPTGSESPKLSPSKRKSGTNSRKERRINRSNSFSTSKSNSPNSSKSAKSTNNMSSLSAALETNDGSYSDTESTKSVNSQLTNSRLSSPKITGKVRNSSGTGSGLTLPAIGRASTPPSARRK